MRHQRGFGLLEGNLALALGLVLLAAASQVTISVHQSWQLQQASARLQDDARLALQRLALDLRMTGMFGCLHLRADAFADPAAAQAFARPLELLKAGDGRLLSLSLISAGLPAAARRPDWTVVTDCRTWARVHDKHHTAREGELALPIRRQVYRLVGDRLLLSSGGNTSALIDQVRDLRITRQAHGERQWIDVQLTLFDAHRGIEQRYDLSVTLRNRLPGA